MLAYKHTESQIRQIEKAIYKSQMKIQKLQEGLREEATKIQSKLREIEERMRSHDREYQNEMMKSKSMGLPTARLGQLTNRKNMDMQTYITLRNGTERYHRMSSELQRENYVLNGLRQKMVAFTQPYR